MTTLFNLFRKDILISGWMILMLLGELLIVFIILLSSMVDEERLISIGFYLTITAIICCTIATLYAFSDELTRSHTVSISLPLSRNMYVMSRYFGSLILLLAGLLVALLAFVPVSAIWDIRIDPVLDYIYQPEMWLFFFCLMILLVSISHPFCFRFGLLKGAWAMVTLFTGLFILCCVLYYYYPVDELFLDWFRYGVLNSVYVESYDEFRSFSPENMSPGITVFRFISLITIGFHMLAFSLCLMMISALTSCNLYNKRDL